MKREAPTRHLADENEGRDNPARINFEKGRYAPLFRRGGNAEEPNAAAGSTLRRALNWKTMALASGWVVAAILGGWFLRIHPRSSDLERSLIPRAPAVESDFLPLWGRFFSSQATNYVVFGSPMFFSSDRLGLFLRKPNLNDPANFVADPNFKTLEEKFGPLTGPRYDYAEMGDAVALQRLTAFFGKSGATLTALPAHQATWDSIKDSNIVFLGTPRMNPLLRKLPVQKDFE